MITFLRLLLASLGVAVGLSAATSDTLRVCISDDEADTTIAAGVFHLLPSSGNANDYFPTISEGSTSSVVSLRVRRSGGSHGTVTVTYATSDITATAGSDYLASTGVLTWANGDNADRIIRVTIRGDTTPEDDEWIQVNLSHPTGGAVIHSDDERGTITIRNDDGPVITSGPGSITALPNDIYAPEGNTGTTFVIVQIARLGGTTGVVSADYDLAGYNGAVAGIDFVPTAGTLTWAAGDAAPKSVSVGIIGDTTWDERKSLVLWISNPTGGATLVHSANITIVDDDPATTITNGILSFTQEVCNVTEGDAGSTLLTCWVTRAGGSTGTVGCSYATIADTATAGSDFLATSGTLSWGPGDTSPKPITVTVLGDRIWEAYEWFSVQLTAVTGGATLGTSAIVTPSYAGPLAITGYLGVPLGTFVQTTAPSRSYAISTLPPGLTLEPYTGVISGTPTANGTTSATVTATNEVGSTTTSVTFTITDPPVSGSGGSSGSGAGGGGCGAGALVGLLLLCGCLTRLRRHTTPARAGPEQLRA